MAPQTDLELHRSDEELLGQVRVTELSRGQHSVWLYANPLGQACFRLEIKEVEECLEELRARNLLEAGLVFASEVRPLRENTLLKPVERRQFAPEMGCQPLLLACHGCGRELERLRTGPEAEDRSTATKEKEVQTTAADIAELLVRSGAKVSSQDVGPQGHTALHLAARDGASQLLSTLLRLGATVAARSGEGHSAEILAERSGRTLCVQILQVASMIQMEKHEAEAEAIAEQETRVAQKKQRAKERRREKKKLERSERAAQRRPASDSEDSHDSAVEEDENVATKEDDQTATKQEAAASAPKASYGRTSYWSALDEDFFPDRLVNDANLPDEWDEENWGIYVDWGEDWDEEDDPGNDSPLSDAEDDDEMRAELVRLRKEKAAQLQQLYSYAAERAERLAKVEAEERETSCLAERAKRLKERKELVLAGDANAQDDTALEAEVSAWWEERATIHARGVWELEKAIAQQQRMHGAEREVLEKQLHEMTKKTRGLEKYLESFYFAQSSNELLELLVSNSRFNAILDELEAMTSSLEISLELKDQLPSFVIPGVDPDATNPLLSSSELVEAAVAHRTIQAKAREHQAHLGQMLEHFNAQLNEKSQDVERAIEEELCHRVMPKASIASGLKAWTRLPESIVQARHSLEMLAAAATERHASPYASQRPRERSHPSRSGSS